MKNSIIYHTLPTIRKYRRQCRRACHLFTRGAKGMKGSIKLHDNQGRNILKTRRWRNRIITRDAATILKQATLIKA